MLGSLCIRGQISLIGWPLHWVSWELLATGSSPQCSHWSLVRCAACAHLQTSWIYCCRFAPAGYTAAVSAEPSSQVHSVLSVQIERYTYMFLFESDALQSRVDTTDNTRWVSAPPAGAALCGVYSLQIGDLASPTLTFTVLCSWLMDYRATT